MCRLLVSALITALCAACSKDAPPPGVSAVPPTGASAVVSATAPGAPGMAASTSGWVPASMPRLQGTRTSPPPDGNVIMLSIDSLRADMPWNGYARPIAPRLTDLEQRAVSFRNAYSVSSYTSMSLGGLLGGRLPSELVRDGYFFGIYKKDLFFPKLLQKAGVHTMGVMAHMYFKGAGFDSGFDDWRIVPGITFDANTDRDITSPQHEKLAEEMLGDPANDSRRFFFWAHFLDPHDIYQHHDGIDWGPNPRDRYDGEVTFTDRYLGKLLDFIAAQSWAQRTTIIVTADHGEEFGEHGMTRHGFEVWNTLVHVPLMIVAPGAPPRHIDVQRSGIDLAPTILQFFGVEGDPSFEGKSLVEEVYGAPTPERDVVVDLPMTSDSGRRRALVHGTEKLICFDTDSSCRLFDLAIDPMERSPIVRGDDYTAMKGRYDALTKTIKEVAPYGCGADCLNSAYRKKQQQQQDGAQ
jgi:choline-sulfatase